MKANIAKNCIPSGAIGYIHPVLNEDTIEFTRNDSTSDLCNYLFPLLSLVVTGINSISDFTKWEDIEEAISGAYGFPVQAMPKAGKFNLETCIYTYPQDPDLEPVGSFHFEKHFDLSVYVFPHAITAFVFNGEVKLITRLD